MRQIYPVKTISLFSKIVYIKPPKVRNAWAFNIRLLIDIYIIPWDIIWTFSRQLLQWWATVTTQLHQHGIQTDTTLPQEIRTEVPSLGYEKFISFCCSPRGKHRCDQVCPFIIQWPVFGDGWGCWFHPRVWNECGLQSETGELTFLGEISGVSLSPDDSLYIGVWDTTDSRLLQYNKCHGYGYQLFSAVFSF